MKYYSDLREYIEALDNNGKLVRVKRKVVKETELAALFWLQFRGLPENEWKSFLFENVIDVKGREHDRVAMGLYSSSREIFALGMMCKVEEMYQKWSYAMSHPIEPEIVESGPAQEVVQMGDELDTAGLQAMAFPVEVPGYSGTVRITNHMITKDPETGARNVGTYSAHVAGRKLLAWGLDPHHHGYDHLRKARRKGIKLPIAVIIGNTPNITLAAAASVPYNADEFGIAGGLAGEPVKLVKCKTIDLEIPATSEIVIEGEVSNDYVLPLTIAHGDYAGYIRGAEGLNRSLIEVTCITHRKDPIFTTGVLGYGHTDIGMLTAIIKELTLYNYLNASYTPRVLDVCCSPYGGGGTYCVIKIKKTDPWDPWQILHSVVGYEPRNPKIAIVVDEDIDCRDPNAVNWALSFAMQPQRDIRIITHRVPGLDPSGYSPGLPREQRRFPPPSGSSAILIDATRKWDYQPVALPKEEWMRQAIKLWEEEGLPKLQLKTPWHGYNLGKWSAEHEESAQLMLKGELDKQLEIMAKSFIRVPESS